MIDYSDLAALARIRRPMTTAAMPSAINWLRNAMKRARGSAPPTLKPNGARLKGAKGTTMGSIDAPHRLDTRRRGLSLGSRPAWVADETQTR